MTEQRFQGISPDVFVLLTKRITQGLAGEIQAQIVLYYDNPFSSKSLEDLLGEVLPATQQEREKEKEITEVKAITGSGVITLSTPMKEYKKLAKFMKSIIDTPTYPGGVDPSDTHFSAWLKDEAQDYGLAYNTNSGSLMIRHYIPPAKNVIFSIKKTQAWHLLAVQFALTSLFPGKKYIILQNHKGNDIISRCTISTIDEIKYEDIQNAVETAANTLFPHKDTLNKDDFKELARAAKKNMTLATPVG
jgi:hypothetical protein